MKYKYYVISKINDEYRVIAECASACDAGQIVGAFRRDFGQAYRDSSVPLTDWFVAVQEVK